MNFTKNNTILIIVLLGAFVLAGLLSLSSIGLAQGPFTGKAPMPTARLSMGTAVADGKIYVTGGNIKWPNSSAVLEVYDPVKDEWVTKSPMSNRKYSHSICALNDMFYSFGGWDNCSSGPFYTKVEVYNPKTDKWTQHSDIP